MPNETGVRIFGFDDLMRPDHVWTLREKIVFNSVYKKWCRMMGKKRKAPEKRIGVLVESESIPLAQMIEKGVYSAEEFINNVEYRLESG
jgi:hypothetical protein